jgi:eukaryotic-like serine/threonine-protein kinase
MVGSARTHRGRLTLASAAVGVLMLAATVGGAAQAAIAGPSTPAKPPKITLTPPFGPPTGMVAVKGKQFGKNDVVTVLFDGDQVAVAHADGRGSFSSQFRVPSMAPPNPKTTVQANGTSGLTAKASFDVTTSSGRFHFDGATSGLNPYENVIGIDNITEVKKLWSYQAGGMVRSSPVIANHIVYVGSEDGAVNAVFTDGAWDWTFQTGGAVTSTPDVTSGVLYVGSSDRSIYALDAKSGSKKWSFLTGGAVVSSPDVDASLGLVFVGSDDGLVYALHTNDGSKAWTSTTGGPIKAAVSVFKGNVYASSLDGKVYALDEATGRLTATYAATDAIETAPSLGTCLGYDWLIFGSDDHYVYAYDITNPGKPKWKDLTSGDVYATPAISCSEGVVFLGTHDWRLQSTDLLTGDIKWWYNCAPQGRAVNSSPLVANGVVYFGCLNGYVYALYSSQRGEQGKRAGMEPMRLPVWKYVTGGAIYSSMAVSDGQVYVGSDDGELYAFGL